jgi:mannosyl-oligosaccharide glucosidase
VDIVRHTVSSRFKDVYGIRSPFLDDQYVDFSMELFSNLLGGLGYFYGDTRIDRSNASEYEESDVSFWESAEAIRKESAAHVPASSPLELLSFVPSRPFFPRGFLWDEGFHLLLVIKWDLDLAVDVLLSWLSLMDEDGWIAREQILGAEARSKVPPEFQVQYPQYANPPTLFWVASSLAEILAANGSTYSGYESHYLSDVDFGRATLQQIFSLLKRQYQWFCRTQVGSAPSSVTSAPSMRTAFRWRGRTHGHTLTSGLDDYPRAEPPHPREMHVDAISWVAMMADSLAAVAQSLGNTEEEAGFRKEAVKTKLVIDDMHWSEGEGSFCDAVSTDQQQHEFVCHQGYISLFPFVLGLMDADDNRIEALLELIRDEDRLWTPFGLRSLSKNDQYYGTGENYWRSPIWININFLVIKQLLVRALSAPTFTQEVLTYLFQSLAEGSGPFGHKARDIYSELRVNVVNTVYNSWRQTGFAWEQYNPDTGAGQRTQHFTGWTALVVEIMSMPELQAYKMPPAADVGSTATAGHRFAKLWLVASGFALILIFRKRILSSARRLLFDR